jgi:replicative DNA helicase
MLPDKLRDLWTQHEQSLLACVIDEQEGVVSDYLIQEGCDTQHFYKPKYKVIWTAIVALRLESEVVDELMLTKKLIEMKQLEAIGGTMTLYDITRLMNDRTWANYKTIWKGQEELYKLYLLQRTSVVMQEKISDKDSPDEIVAMCGAEFDKLQTSADAQLQPASEYIPSAKKELETPSVLTKGILTDLSRYDAKTGGLKPSTFVVWAARPAMGKSTIAMNVINTTAISKKKVLFFSAEMTSLEIGIRQISSMCLINQDHIRNKRISPNDERLVEIMTNGLAKSKIWIDDSSDITPSRIAARARALKNREGLDLIVIDYLQIITPDNPKDIREQQISAISRSFKKLSRRLNIPVLCLAQLNRGSAKEEREPRLSDLRESGAIEQDADVVGLLHQTEDMEKDNLIQFDIAKQRNGETGKFQLDYIKQWFKFGDKDTVEKLRTHLAQGTQQQLIP